jgi:hypothetical protein
MLMKHRITIILTIALSFQFTLVVAQPMADSLTYKTNIFIQIGTSANYLKDKSFSPLNYRSGGLVLKAGFAQSINRYQLCFNLTYVSGNLKNKQVTSFTTPFIDANVELACLREIRKNKRNNFNNFVGLQYSTLIHFMQWGDMDSWGYLMYHGLNANSMAIWRISGSKRVHIGVAIPLAGILVRPPYNGYDYFIEQHQDNFIRLAFKGKLTTWNHYQGLNCRVSYITHMGGRLHFEFAYDLSYQGTDVTQKFRYFKNQFTVGFNRI